MRCGLLRLLEPSKPGLPRVVCIALVFFLKAVSSQVALSETLFLELECDSVLARAFTIRDQLSEEVVFQAIVHERVVLERLQDLPQMRVHVRLEPSQRGGNVFLGLIISRQLRLRCKSGLGKVEQGDGILRFPLSFRFRSLKPLALYAILLQADGLQMLHVVILGIVVVDTVERGLS